MLHNMLPNVLSNMLSNCKAKSYNGNNFRVNDGRRRRRRRRVILTSRAAPPLRGRQPKSVKLKKRNFFARNLSDFVAT